MPAGGAESGAAARGQGGGLSAARLWQEARHPQVEVTTDSETLARALSDSEPGFAGPRTL